MNNKLVILGHIGVGGQKGFVYHINGVASTIPATSYKDPMKIVVERKGSDEMTESVYCIRKLTPTECFRLMGFKDEYVEKARKLNVSNSSLYKQAGNSMITNCVALLAEHLYKAQYDNTYVCTDENFTRPQ